MPRVTFRCRRRRRRGQALAPASPSLNTVPWRRPPGRSRHLGLARIRAGIRRVRSSRAGAQSLQRHGPPLTSMQLEVVPTWSIGAHRGGSTKHCSSSWRRAAGSPSAAGCSSLTRAAWASRGYPAPWRRSLAATAINWCETTLHESDAAPRQSQRCCVSDDQKNGPPKTLLLSTLPLGATCLRGFGI